MSDSVDATATRWPLRRAIMDGSTARTAWTTPM
jgi:hypothetical protein